MINPLVQKPGRPLFLAKMNVMVVSRVNDKMILLFDYLNHKLLHFCPTRFGPLDLSTERIACT